MAVKVLVVDDEKMIVKGLRFSLQQDGYEVECAYDGEEALGMIRERQYDIVLLDVMLPKLSGFEVLQQVREFSDVPVIMLTARGDDMDKILGLDYGADDYVTKPFNPLELVARVKSQLRRYTRLGSMDAYQQVDIVRNGGLEINMETHEVKVDGEEKKLTPVEFGILSFLTKNAGKVFSINQIYENVWKEPSMNAENTVSVHIRRIREKIEINAKNPKYVKVVWGVGYKVEKME